MGDYVKRRLIIVLGILIFTVCLGCVIVGQRTAGWLYLGLMLLGLFGLLVLLYLYNRSVERPRNEGQNASAPQKAKSLGEDQ